MPRTATERPSEDLERSRTLRRLANACRFLGVPGLRIGHIAGMAAAAGALFFAAACSLSVAGLTSPARARHSGLKAQSRQNPKLQREVERDKTQHPE